MIRLKQTDNIIISGHKHTGKSTLAMYFTSMFPRYVVYDRLRYFRDHGFENVYVPTTPSVEEYDGFIGAMLTIGNMMIVVDEGQEVMPEKRLLSPNAYQAVMYGRHDPYNIGLIVTTKRPALLNKSVLGEADYYIVFRHMISCDIDSIGEIVGKDNAEKIRVLQDHRFYVYDNSGGPGTGKFTGPHMINLADSNSPLYRASDYVRK